MKPDWENAFQGYLAGRSFTYEEILRGNRELVLPTLRDFFMIGVRAGIEASAKINEEESRMQKAQFSTNEAAVLWKCAYLILDLLPSEDAGKGGG